MEGYTVLLDRNNQHCENEYAVTAICRFSAIPPRLSVAFLTELEQKMLHFVWKHERPQIAKAVLRQRNVAGGIRLLNFRLCYKMTLIKATWSWPKNRNTDQWNRIGCPEVNPHTYGPLVSYRRGKTIQQRKGSLFHKWCWENWAADTQGNLFSMPSAPRYQDQHGQHEHLPALELNSSHSSLLYFDP